MVHIAPDGTVTVVAGGPEAGLDRPEGVAVGGDGTVYVSDARHRVASITPGGRPRIVAGNGSAGAPVPGPALASPAGLAVDRAGNLYIADDGAILRVTPAGGLDVAGIAGAGLLAVPLGVCLVAAAAVARRRMERDGTRL
ncbi:hypothetical protein ACPPVO_16680 [Dactylosporangium sp. McL0621]|uniref:hypothetical protein n=1 Tax=Dactylosporangium sp. McL0621 TaxID=3415678 RepID=UPI003CF37F8D